MSKSNHPGSRKVKKIVENAWSEEVMLEAINKIQSTPVCPYVRWQKTLD